ncbi:LysR family transcriptional regulator [Rhizobium calliandrae]|uniref:LysR family transcriptional regulator n=1 Tax=Rhizobium calliandrae TaxID=1312182 RepID=A0ABT7KNC8_9HYPH|nr:LysR family transcriptional regulator [Rhizobium calliandrae]MDL2409443.1 LysR family transcriptional regulator [Rhizobium calliandrae]
MKMDERHLIQLAAVVQAGGVTEGAALLGLTQPAVSRTLAMLEKRLGEPLFVKGRRPLQPTPLGRALADHGQAMLTAARKASLLVDGFRHGRTGVVRVGGTPFFMDALISGMVAEFQNSVPDVRVEQSYGYLPDLRAAINADRIDLAICPIDVLEEGSGMRFQELLPGRNVVACRVTHPLRLRRKLAPAELLDYPWIAPPPGSPLFQDLHSLVLSLGATEAKIRYSGGSLASAINYMKASDALTILPHSVVFAYRNEKAITALPVNIPHPERALGLLRRTEEIRSPAAEAFSAHIRKSFENLKHLIKRHEQSVIWSL